MKIRRVLVGILVANLVVVGAKLVIGLGTGSLAVLGDVVHSSVDAMNNVLALIVMAIASRGPDEDHPYGHQKFETLGALAIVGFLSISGFELVRGAVQRLMAGAPPLHVSGIQILVLSGTLVVNTVVATYESRRGSQLNSEILLADAAHTKADIVISMGVLSGVLLAGSGAAWADPIVALAVAGVIVVLAYRIVARSIPVLVDQHVVPSEEIQSSAESVDGVKEAYGIRSRGSRELAFAELTISVDRGASIETAHKIADDVESELRRQLSLHEIVVHIEPC
ncbi:MAG: cation diffusion facilitator family transporter [Gemmatimonadales bacterium]